MTKKHKGYFYFGIGTAGFIAIFAFAHGAPYNITSLLKADNNSYGLSLSSSKNKLYDHDDDNYHSGKTIINTNKGSNIGVNYVEVKYYEDGWQILKDDGYFYNDNAIHGLSNLNINLSNNNVDIKIYYSYDNSLSNSEVINIIDGSYSYDFNNYYPNYIKLENISGFDINITSINLSFDCVDHESPDIDYGTIPNKINEKQITYGLYPQSNVTDESLLASLNSLGDEYKNNIGWYLYNNHYYVKVNQTKTINGYVSGNIYWFNCELITWNILNNNDGTYYLLSDVLLDVQQYYSSGNDRTIDDKTIYPNNYQYSDIRTWLNNDFYSKAFNLNSSYILNTEVDNSAATTNSDTNPCVCDNTNDNVFLPSYRDYRNTSYEFDSKENVSDTRKATASDYAKAMGASVSGGYSPYWTRSPRSSVQNVQYVDEGGRVSTFIGATTNNLGVRPAIKITL